VKLKPMPKLSNEPELLHDIGKCLPDNSKRHNILGAEFVKKYGENQIVVDAIKKSFPK